ncbi:MAG: von Willebrand factor type A domain-containing protein [Chloroflexi bacterium]|nr:von Willebrand factor type A domain-containing protein [Chloroflexota bacterium]
MARPPGPAPPPAAGGPPAAAEPVADAGGGVAGRATDDGPSVAEPLAIPTPETGPVAPQAGKHPPGLDHPPRPPQPAATTFENYGRTPFVEASTDAISTFSLDADRTSYFLALTWVRNGYTVEPDSVRAEEWINAFDYGYALPGDDRRFAVTSEVARHPLEAGQHLVRIALQAPEVRDDAPLNVTLVLDASGSMGQGNRVAIAREAAETIRRSLGARDRIAVVHFTGDVLDAYTIEHSAPGDEDVASSIGRLAPHGSTNVQAGLDLGVRLAAAARLERPGAYNYVILMSDGVANVDATDPFAILEGAPDSDSANPLRLITIGVGIENYNDVLLEQLAQHGNGWYRYLDDAAQARETFRRESWLALSTPFADQARAQVRWDPAVVQAWRIVGYENRITPDHTFEQDRREFSELPSGTATTVLYEIVLNEGARDGSARLGRVDLRWVDPSSGESRSQSAEVRGYRDASFAGSDRYFRLAAIVGLAADRYSALSPQVENQAVDHAGIFDDLSALSRELAVLRELLGSLEAYDDAQFLLNRLTQVAAERAPASGYSR